MSIKYEVTLVNGEKFELDKEEDIVELKRGFICFYTSFKKGKIIPANQVLEISFVDEDEEDEEEEEKKEEEVKPKKSLLNSLFKGGEKK